MGLGIRVWFGISFTLKVIGDHIMKAYVPRLEAAATANRYDGDFVAVMTELDA